MRPSSAMCRTTFTSSLRRSSVSSGIARRISLPSLFGVRPRSDSMIAFSIALIEDLSYGWIDQQPRLGRVDRRELLERRLRRRSSRPSTRSSSAGLARPVRTEPNSWFGRLDGLLHALARVREELVDHLAHQVVHQRSDPLAGHYPVDVSLVVHVEDVDRHVVLHAERERGGVHHAQPALHRVHVGDLAESAAPRGPRAGPPCRRPRRRSWPSGSPRRGSRWRAARRPCRS